MENKTPGQDVTISADQPWANITICLLSRGGVLVDSITDSLTGKRIRLERVFVFPIDQENAKREHLPNLPNSPEGQATAPSLNYCRRLYSPAYVLCLFTNERYCLRPS